MVKLYDHQKKAVQKLHNGNILFGGVGSGKSITALVYYFEKVCEGHIDEGRYSKMKKPRDLYIITTARKRDTFEWDKECANLYLSRDDAGRDGTKLTIDSWNNIEKYTSVTGAFFIFDEQRVVGSGKWVKSFLAIAKKNQWILLSATPGDTWCDYIPVFVANGFYKNRSEFLRRHVVFSPYTKFPKIDRYLEVGRLVKIRDSILVKMDYNKKTERHDEDVLVEYDKSLYNFVNKNKWNVFTDEPIENASQYCSTIRRIVNESGDRIEKCRELIRSNPKSIIFYNFNYELEALRLLCNEEAIPFAEWNGHKHEPIPKLPQWIYLVQYAAGCEGWNCVETDTIIFYSQSYSYKQTEQAEGRIDRINTPFEDLYYYHLKSKAPIDFAISRCLTDKKDFNESSFFSSNFDAS